MSIEEVNLLDYIVVCISEFASRYKMHMRDTIQEVVRYLVEDEGITMNRAMERFYMSDTFEKLNNIDTGLYLEGSVYIFDMLKRESMGL